jgi:hypothetical protein
VARGAGAVRVQRRVAERAAAQPVGLISSSPPTTRRFAAAAA